MDKYPFNRSFECAVAAVLLSDPAAAMRLSRALEADMFPDRWVGYVVKLAQAHIERFGTVPTGLLMLQQARDEVEHGRMTYSDMDAVSDLLDELEALPGVDVPAVVERMLAEARRLAIGRALDDGIKAFGRGNHDEVLDLLVRADSVGRADLDLGHDLRDVAERARRRTEGETVQRYPMGIPLLDEALLGGPAAGEVVVVMGGPGGGKTMTLCQVAATTAALGGVAVYYLLEGSPDTVDDRLDSQLSNVPLNMLDQHADLVAQRVQEAVPPGATVVVKRFPGNLTTVRELEVHLRELRALRSIEPTVVIVDYADLLAPTRSRDDESDYARVGNVYVDLAGLGVRWGVPVWTASQVRREAVTKAVVTMGDIAESFRKCHHADVVMAVTQTAEERENNELYMYLAKVRYAEGKKRVGPFRSGFEFGCLALRDDNEPQGLPSALHGGDDFGA